MIHQVSVPLWYLTDVRRGEVNAMKVSAGRGMKVGDFICFECNDARFPKGVRRWEYAQVLSLSLLRSGGVQSSGVCKVVAGFERVEDLRDVILT